MDSATLRFLPHDNFASTCILPTCIYSHFKYLRSVVSCCINKQNSAVVYATAKVAMCIQTKGETKRGHNKSGISNVAYGKK